MRIIVLSVSAGVVAAEPLQQVLVVVGAAVQLQQRT
jgi:hypothetical protein